MPDPRKNNLGPPQIVGCAEFEDLVADYRRNALSDLDRNLCDAHLEACGHCKETLALWSGFTACIEDIMPPALPPLVERRMIVDAVNPDHGKPVTPRRAPLLWASGFGIAAAAAVAVILVASTDQTSETIRRQDVSQISPEEGDALPVLTQTLENGRTLMKIDPVTELWVDGDSSVNLEINNRKEALVRLEKGRIIADIGPHEGGYKFVVSTPRGEVEAKGTVFSVEVSEDKDTARVIEGAVEVRQMFSGDQKGNSFMVLARQAGEIGDTSARWAEEESIVRDLCLMRGCLTEEQSTISVAEGMHEVKDKHARKYENAPEAGNPKEKKLQVKETAASKATQAKKQPMETPEQAQSASSKASIAQPSQEQPAPTLSGATDLMREALEQRRNGSFKSAAATYSALIKRYPGSPEALNALVSLGQLELTSLSAPANALRHFDDYLKSAPKGILAQEARLGKVRASWRSGRFAAAKAASTAYLETHPGGYAGAEVMKIRADSKRKLGDCDGAVDDYNKIRFWWPTSKEAAAAEAGISACSGQ